METSSSHAPWNWTRGAPCDQTTVGLLPGVVERHAFRDQVGGQCVEMKRDLFNEIGIESQLVGRLRAL